MVVLPTPPFWLATTITRVASGRGRAWGEPADCGPARNARPPGPAGRLVVETGGSRRRGPRPSDHEPGGHGDVSRETTGGAPVDEWPILWITTLIGQWSRPVEKSWSRATGPAGLRRFGHVIGLRPRDWSNAPSATVACPSDDPTYPCGSAQATRTATVGGETASRAELEHHPASGTPDDARSARLVDLRGDECPSSPAARRPGRPAAWTNQQPVQGSHCPRGDHVERRSPCRASARRGRPRRCRDRALDHLVR